MTELSPVPAESDKAVGGSVLHCQPVYHWSDMLALVPAQGSRPVLAGFIVSDSSTY